MSGVDLGELQQQTTLQQVQATSLKDEPVAPDLGNVDENTAHKEEEAAQNHWQVMARDARARDAPAH